MQKTLALLAILAALPLINACSTTAGAGHDISKAGNDLTKSAVQHTP